MPITKQIIAATVRQTAARLAARRHQAVMASRDTGIDRRQLNRVIGLALGATARDSSGRSKRILLRLNHARTLLDNGFIVPARLAIALAQRAI